MKKLCMILPLALILCFMVGCQDKEAMAELEEFKAQAAVEEQNKALVMRYTEELNKRNLEIFNELCAPDYRYHYPSQDPNPLSRDEMIDMMKYFYQAFPDLIWSIEDVIAEGDKVAYRFIGRGTHEGEFRGVPATGNKIEVSGVFFTRIKNGKIVEDREEYDLLGKMMKLGMELKPKEEK